MENAVRNILLFVTVSTGIIGIGYNSFMALKNLIEYGVQMSTPYFPYILASTSFFLLCYWAAHTIQPIKLLSNEHLKIVLVIASLLAFAIAIGAIIRMLTQTGFSTFNIRDWMYVLGATLQYLGLASLLLFAAHITSKLETQND